jgi:hypothetical protein
MIMKFVCSYIQAYLCIALCSVQMFGPCSYHPILDAIFSAEGWVPFQKFAFIICLRQHLLGAVVKMSSLAVSQNEYIVF